MDMAADTSYIPYADPLWHHPSRPSPYYRESHYRLQREIRKYVTEYLQPHCAEWELAGEVPPSVLQRHAAMGYSAVSIYPLASPDFLLPTTSELTGKRLQSQRLPAGINPGEWDAFHDLVFIVRISSCLSDTDVLLTVNRMRWRGAVT